MLAVTVQGPVKKQCFQHCGSSGEGVSERVRSVMPVPRVTLRSLALEGASEVALYNLPPRERTSLPLSQTDEVLRSYGRTTTNDRLLPDLP